ncbi:hypothetical protein AVEN_138466-1 [Araneus ventricosus]|uniref:Histone-lysine N-methyltransferase SETMAR n=1 Tax=Araneus ventricosus TaxID=182803 RepID=A0A4Y2CES0_ARAVE|nr:hypothetical protein AVEN_138466-1 [Araneus ventricosus]
MLRHLSLLHRHQNAGHLRIASSARKHSFLSDGVNLLHKNVIPYSTRVTQQLIESFGWKQMNHPPYSPDLAPSDYCQFLHLKLFLSG